MQRHQQWVQEGAGRGRPWQGRAFWSHNTQPGNQRPVRGVGILLRDGVVPVDVQVSVEFSDVTGRLLRIGWELSSSDRWSVVAVYAPAVAAERSGFFLDNYFEALDSGAADSKLIVGGISTVPPLFWTCNLCLVSKQPLVVDLLAAIT
jgi:hypothetical protein